jgi:DNA polymerase III delta prime subunit
VILDEADGLSSDAQLLLRRVMETYVKNCRFIFIVNYLHKIIDPIKSRCLAFRFAPLRHDHIKQRLQFIALQEKVDLDLDHLIAQTNGDMRQCIINMQFKEWMDPMEIDLPSSDIEAEALFEYTEANGGLPKYKETFRKLHSSSFPNQE